MARTSLRLALAATTAILALLFAPLAPAFAGASEGATWLAQQIGTKGYIQGRNGAPDGPNTAYAVLAMYSAGQGSASKPAVTWLQDHIDDVANAGGTDNPGSLAILIMALRAAGENVDSLVTRLQKTQVTSGPDTGLFGIADPTFDGAARQGLSLLALASVRQSNATAADWLVKQQCADGSWQSYRTSTAVPCGTPDPTKGTGPDTNSTAVAYEGLKASGVKPTYDPLAWLASVETPDAGWTFYGGTSTPPDANSTALIIQAVIASGNDPASPLLTHNGTTPPTRLASFQLPTGAFTFAGGNEANILATVQAVPAAAGKIFPLPAAASPLVSESSDMSVLWIVLILLVLLAAGAAVAFPLIRHRRLKPAT